MTAQILIALTTFLVGSWIGYKIGRAINADDAWVEGYFAKMREKVVPLRDSRGRFKSVQK